MNVKLETPQQKIVAIASNKGLTVEIYLTQAELRNCANGIAVINGELSLESIECVLFTWLRRADIIIETSHGVYTPVRPYCENI